MLKYAKVYDEKTGLCSVGIGNNTNFYESIGFTLQEVEEVDGVFYLKNKAPKADLEKTRLNKKQELLKKRDEYLKLNNYDLSENDKFNIQNLIGWTEEDRNKYINFLKNDLIVKYDYYNNKIKQAENNDDLEFIINFNE